MRQATLAAQVAMLRLMVRSQSPAQVILEVHGWVSGDAVPLLEQEGERWLRQADRLVLALGGVRHLDGDALDLLRRWTGQRLLLVEPTPFIRDLLEVHDLGVAELPC